ncbi:hypothetical protein TRL7639_00472 [Falsiruegeria litorea R37]|uniref:DUF3299 domain-containing protein n=1 Tax=Falsiruegeria litorea R37 TaxID=1200284 RepID=A0A1Y5RKY9_9RHOB|nr:DUF3299 domain-containing protein [Falsiruegeria litorea]SLN19909.1 hypothetical protein TRL7639_00472 [Falsiruegeria litorea R37]
MKLQSAMFKRQMIAFVSIGILMLLPELSLAQQQIGWRDLTIPVEPQDDPYFALGFESRKALEELLVLESYREDDNDLSAKASQRVAELHEELASAGLGAQALIDKDRNFQAKIVAQRSMVRAEWDGLEIKIPGYVLPLEFNGNQVVEFLLVPYVGACIHTPPPPANQIVHVRSNVSFQANGLFIPVWVTGKMTIEKSQQSVGLSDGVTGFEVGYALHATEVVEYKQ